MRSLKNKVGGGLESQDPCCSTDIEKGIQACVCRVTRATSRPGELAEINERRKPLRIGRSQWRRIVELLRIFHYYGRIMNTYVYRPAVAPMGFSESMEELKRIGHRVVAAAVDGASPAVVQEILDLARKGGIEFLPYEIDVEDFLRYIAAGGYTKRYADYYRDNRMEKALEHYVALELLNLSESDVFIDIASEHSPVAEIYSRLTGSTSFSQDIMYPGGIHGSQIGGDACSMPVPDGFASKASLTCSFEHFEEDADKHLFRELSRVLKPGGAVCVIPFYVFVEPVTQTDPTVSVPSNVRFDPGTTIYCAEGWGNRHGRFYSPQVFIERILNPVKDKFRFEFYHLENAAEVDASVYARFAFVATRF